MAVAGAALHAVAREVIVKARARQLICESLQLMMVEILEARRLAMTASGESIPVLDSSSSDDEADTAYSNTSDSDSDVQIVGNFGLHPLPPMEDLGTEIWLD